MRFPHTLTLSMVLLAACLVAAGLNDYFFTAGNLEHLLSMIALFGIISIGVSFVMVTGGIDLSVGSLVCLAGIGLPWLLATYQWPLAAALPAVLLTCAVLGFLHGTLITRLRLQPFIVTLCGLLLYRGLARGMSSDHPLSWGPGFYSLGGIARAMTRDHPVLLGPGFDSLRSLATGRIPPPSVDGFSLPAPLLILMAISVLAAILLHATVPGRHLFALGQNEESARSCGINTRGLTVMAYVISATLAGVAGMLFVFSVDSAHPADFGNFYELYALTAAVLGGFSLRGGQGTIAGVLVGTALVQVILNILHISSSYQHLEFALIGALLLAAVIADELLHRCAHRNRTRAAAARLPAAAATSKD
jgi:ribose transport system permease protein